MVILYDVIVHGPVVPMVENAIHQINLYPMNSVIGFLNP